MSKDIEMIGRGHRGDIGGWDDGDKMTVSAGLADELVRCGLARYVSAPAAPAPAKKKKEVTSDGEK